MIRLLYRTFKEKLKIQGHHPFEFKFGFTTTCIMIVCENAINLVRIKAGMGVKII